MPRSVHLIGLDIGSTVIKAVRFDTRGRLVARAARVVPIKRPRPGWVERDAGATWKAAASALREIAAVSRGHVTALGITGCGNGAVFVDRNLRPLRAGILSSDVRALALLRKTAIRAGGQQGYAGQLPWLLAWFRRHEPSRARKLRAALFWKDFLRARLTGELATDFTDAGAGGLLRFPDRQLLRQDPALPVPQESLSRAGALTPAAARETRLPSGLPVYTGCIDCEASALGSGLARSDEASVVAGTWSINQAFVRTLPRSAEHFLINPSVDPARWLVIEGSPCSASHFDWAVTAFESDRDFARAAASAARTIHSPLLFLPHLHSGQAAFIGLSAGHSKGALYRAVMEGIVFAHRAHLEELVRTTGQLRKIRLSGGATRSPFWCQLFADGLDLPVVVPRGEELGALGAAICAGVGEGLWPTLRAAQTAMVPAARVFSPRAEAHQALTRSFVRYRETLEAFVR